MRVLFAVHSGCLSLHLWPPLSTLHLSLLWRPLPLPMPLHMMHSHPPRSPRPPGPFHRDCDRSVGRYLWKRSSWPRSAPDPLALAPGRDRSHTLTRQKKRWSVRAQVESSAFLFSVLLFFGFSVFSFQCVRRRRFCALRFIFVRCTRPPLETFFTELNPLATSCSLYAAAAAAAAAASLPAPAATATLLSLLPVSGPAL